ncbi:hypothetical protein L6R52_11445, partial [Myxococcota bacterium]|nr:hypothetical protein [Myxococcota bacterium]
VRADRVAGAGATAPRAADAVAPAAPVAQVSDADYQEALDNQRALSEARQELGNAQLELENRNIFQRGWDFVTGGDDAKEQRIGELEQAVADLEAEEAKLPPDAVAQARLTVFEERLAAIEATQGKGEAARLARQTYYNSDVWNGAAGTGKASEAEIDAAGFPRGAWHSGAATDGYDGEMQTRDGNVVDMGHVACALDWQVNGRGGFPNPFDANAVTLTGDLASAILRTPAGGDPAAAIDAEGDADWNGDLDGNNLAKRLADDPDASLADTVRGYYSGDYRDRIDEWATHSKYVERSDDGVPLRDADGHYVLDRDQLQRDANGFAVLLSQGGTLNPLNRFEDRAVIDAWADWFAEQPQTLE